MVRWLRGPSALEQLGASFDELVDTAGAPLTAGRTWLQTWVDTYRAYEPMVAVVDGPGGRLDACAPLARRRRGAVLDITNLGRGPGDYVVFPARDDAAAQALAEGVAGELARVRTPWRLRIEQLPVGDPVTAALATRLAHGSIEPGDPSPIAVLTADTDIDALIRPRMRRTVRTGTKRLTEEGRRVEWVHERDAAAIGAYVPEIEAVWRLRDAAAGRRIGADDPAEFGFFLAVVRRLADESKIELTALLVDGHMAAFAVCLLDGAAYRVWVPRYAPAFRGYNPGFLAARDLLEQARVQGFTEFDWMRGEEPYKLQSTTDLVEHEHLTAWSSPVLRTVVEQARRAKDYTSRRSAAATAAP